MLSKLGKQVESVLLDILNDLPPLKPLPPEPVLARKLGVSRHTIRTALADMESKELVRRIKRKGTFPAQGNKAPPIFQRRAKMIGVVAMRPFGFAKYSRMIAAGAFEEACIHGYNLVIAKLNSKSNIYQILDDPHVEGLLLFPSVRDQALIRELSGRKKPICVIDHYTSTEGVDSVEIDTQKGMVLAVRHLYQLGHRKIAFVDVDDPELNPARVRGYEKAMKDLRVFTKPEWKIERANTFEGGQAAATHLLSLHPSKRPTAMIISTTKMVCGAVKIILKRGLKIPKDISLISLGGEMPPLLKDAPQVTRITSKLGDLGKFAIDLLLERIKKPHLPRRVTLIPSQLEIHETTGKI